MHALVVAVIFGAYITLMVIIGWCMTGQLNDCGDGDDDALTVAVVDSTPYARHSTG